MSLEATKTNKLASVITPASPGEAAKLGFRVDEPMTPLVSITNYNNFYEFSTSKEGMAPAAPVRDVIVDA